MYNKKCVILVKIAKKMRKFMKNEVKMTNLEKLNNILLSDNVKEEFYKALNEKEFEEFLRSNIPEIFDCKDNAQNNPWHIYNILDHILVSVEKMNAQTKEMAEEERKILAYTMLFHDIGKPAKKIQRMKQGKMIDSFIKHNEESEKIAKARLENLGFSGQEKEIIEKLVYKHDIFMFIKPFLSNNPHWRMLSPNLVEEEIEDLSSCGDGEKLLKWLVMVGRSDSLAQNPEMTRESLELLDLFDEMIKERGDDGREI